jgi:chromosome segregation ATPase
LILLALLSVGLAIALYLQQQRAATEQQTAEQTVQQLSNSWNQTSAELHLKILENAQLQSNLVQRAEALSQTSNRLAELEQALAKVQADAQAAATQAQAELAQRDARINALESERDELTERMVQLNASITGLEKQIAETERQLAASEGDRQFLLKELKRLQAEKAELERRFNDLLALREQVRKLKDELAIARRLDWIRRGLAGAALKGAERLQRGFVPPPPPPKHDLQVEMSTQGEVKVTPSPTNAPAPTPPSTGAPPP